MGLFDKQKIDRAKSFSDMEFATEADKRNAEECLLKPINIPPYAGELPKHSNELESRTALIVFRDAAQMELVGELFSIRESCSGKLYITDITLLETMAREVRAGSMYVKDGSVFVDSTYVNEDVQYGDEEVETIDIKEELKEYVGAYLGSAFDKELTKIVYEGAIQECTDEDVETYLNQPTMDAAILKLPDDYVDALVKSSVPEVPPRPRLIPLVAATVTAPRRKLNLWDRETK